MSRDVAASTLSRWRGALVDTTMVSGLALAVAATPVMAPGTAHAADWLGSSGDFNLGSNWAGGTVPTDTATFTNSSTAERNVTASGGSLMLLEYNNNALAYTLSTAPGSALSITNITNNSTFEQTLFAGAAGGFVISGTITGAVALIAGPGSGAMQFGAGSSAAGSRFIGQGGLLNLGMGGGNTLSIGSIEGTGVIRAFGATQTLSVGGLNSSTTYAGVIQDSVALTKVGTGALTLSGANIYTGSTTISAGSIIAGNDSAFSTGLVTLNGGTLATTGARAIGNAVSLTGSSAIRVLDTTATFSGPIATGGNALSLEGAGNGTIGGVISGSGTVTKNGTGTFTLSGANTYTGVTTINAGTLMVNGSLASSSVSVGSGTTLGGSGAIAGAVTVAAGGTLSAGNSPGTLTVGSLALNAGSNTVFELGTPGVAGGATNDHIIINGIGAAGNLTLGGTLTATAASAGYYRLFDVTGGGTISGSFNTLALTAPSVGGAVGTIYNAPSTAATQVNLAVIGAGQNLQFWDGADLTGNGAVDGGVGTWNASDTNWTGTPGSAGVNAPWRGSVGVFQGSAGAVTVAGTQDFDTLQFNSSGYVLNGDALRFGVASGGTINTMPGVTTTIGSNLVDGAGSSLTKVGAGTLALTGANSYTGATIVDAGRLLLGASNTLPGQTALSLASGASFDLNGFAQSIGSLAGAGTASLTGATLTTGADGTSTEFSGTLSGDGSLVKNGTGTFTLSGTNSYTGTTTVNAGTLRMGAANALTSSAGIILEGSSTWDLNGYNQTVQRLEGNAPGTAVDLGTATLTIDNSAFFVFRGDISGSGGLTKTGSAGLNIFGTNTYSGPTNVAGGTLRIGQGGSILNSTAINVSNGARFVVYEPNALSPTGAVSLTGAGSQFETLFDQQIGSLAGGADASVILGPGAVLTTGANNMSTVFNGSIGSIFGDGSLTKAGTGSFTLNGANTYEGATLVNAGSLIVNGSIASSTVSVGSGATLSGSGTIAGAVTIGSGGTLAAGNSPGTLTVGSLTLNSGSNTVFELNSPGVVGGATNDRIIVNGTGPSGNLQLGGTLTANVASAGYYRLFDVTGGGTISGSFDTLALSAPSVSGAVGTLYNAPSGSPTQVNLAVVGAGQNLQFWDGADDVGNRTVDGGAGTWNAGNTNWAVAPGDIGFNAPWLGSVGVFQGTAGAVTVAGTQDFDTLQFNSSGYILNGDALRFGVAGGGTLNTAAGVTTTIGSALVDGIGTDLSKVGAGTLVLSGTSRYTGATLVNAGALIVDGSIASSSSLTIAAGATLAGSGQLPSTTVNGTLSPGNSPGTLTVNGNLAMGAGSVYLAEIQGAIADRVNVTGVASLAGTLQLAPLGGAYAFSTPYTLLTAAKGLGGTAFGTVDTTGSFGDGVVTTVSYTNNDVRLTLTPKPLTPDPKPPGTPELGVKAPRNAVAVASGIDRAVANGGDPSSLFGIYNLPAASIPAAVNSLSGEVHTAAPAMANVASDQFLRVMLDPTAMGRLGDAGAAGPGTAMFSGLVRKGADRPAGPSRLDLPFYSVWGSAYGSYGRTDGNAGIGSAKRTIDDAHLATGIDLRLLPGTVAGVAISGGKARASLPGVLGKVDAEVFQAGLYGVTQLGPVRIGAALSYARLENDVSRSIPALGSSLSSSYGTTAWSGRLQASAALLNWNGLSLSPLAAIQATRARSPAVIEANWAGANAGALALAGRSDITARSELGLQLDADTVLGGVAVTGYARAAWAHYVRRDADLTASLIGLPGASFTATGAEGDRNSALVSGGVTARLSERVSLGLNLDGEISANSNRLGGSAQLRVSF